MHNPSCAEEVDAFCANLSRNFLAAMAALDPEAADATEAAEAETAAEAEGAAEAAEGAEETRVAVGRAAAGMASIVMHFVRWSVGCIRYGVHKVWGASGN